MSVVKKTRHHELKLQQEGSRLLTNSSILEEGREEQRLGCLRALWDGHQLSLQGLLMILSGLNFHISTTFV